MSNRVLKAVLNRAKVTIDGTITSGATTTNVVASDGAKLPQPSTDGSFYLTIYDASQYSDPADDPNAEELLVTARTGDALTHSAAAYNHTTLTSTYIGFISLPKAEIDSIDDFLRDIMRDVTSVTYNDYGQIIEIITSVRTYTFTHDVYGEIATIVTNDTPAKTYTVVRDNIGRLSSITLT